MTYTFYNNSEGIYILYDSVSGAVIRSGELEAYICDALDPCGEKLSHLPEKCPSEIRYELARFSSTEVSSAYAKIKEYFEAGLIYGCGASNRIRTTGDHSANTSMLSAISSETGIRESDFERI